MIDKKYVIEGYYIDGDDIYREYASEEAANCAYNKITYTTDCVIRLSPHFDMRDIPDVNRWVSSMVIHRFGEAVKGHYVELLTNGVWII